MSDEQARRLRISGRVQGVWYRAWMTREAARLGVRGWVRNRRDGTVEALVVGPEAALAEIALRCREGPPAARVAGVEAVPAEDDGSQGFRQEATV